MIGKRRVLVVDDEESLLKVLTDKLTREGFEVLTAKNGQLGLAAALAERPDLILLDIIMPKMDGITMLRQLHQDRTGRNIPVVILTNLSDDKQVEAAMTAGAYDYLVKTDWTLDELMHKVKEVLNRATLYPPLKS